MSVMVDAVHCSSCRHELIGLVVGKSSRRRDPAEFSGTFWNSYLVYKVDIHCILIGLQQNTLYSKSNQRAIGFLRHSCLLRL